LVLDNYTHDAERFTRVAERYCGIVDAAARLEKEQILLQIYRILPELIGEAIRLPDTNPFEREKEDAQGDQLSPAAPDMSISHKEWQDIYHRLQKKLGDADVYWTVFDPTKDQDVICGSLSDDIADIYRGLRKRLVEFRESASTPSLVIWDWRVGFYSHWGDHATSALRTIHALLQETVGDGKSV
jgi:Domain of unknown function (DUF5063)